MRLLLVEDNPDLADAIIRRMRRSGHAVDWQADGLAAASVLRYQSFDLVVLDIGLPKLDGLRVLAGMRERGDSTPVLMLTARDGIEDRVQALDVGADDYLGKPFDFREFEARCRVLLRRARGQASEVVQIGGFQFDNAAHRVSLDGEPIELPNREYRLLEILVGRLGQVVGKDEIGNGLFGFDDEAGPNAIEFPPPTAGQSPASPLRCRPARGSHPAGSGSLRRVTPSAAGRSVHGRHDESRWDVRPGQEPAPVNVGGEEGRLASSRSVSPLHSGASAVPEDADALNLEVLRVPRHHGRVVEPGDTRDERVPESARTCPAEPPP